MREYDAFPITNVNPVHYMMSIAKVSGSFVFMTVTETGLKKSIMDATGLVRMFLRENNLHDYSTQLQGPEHKVILKTCFVKPDGIVETKASLYRPVTKKGDPRIWFTGLKDIASPQDLLVIFALHGSLYLANCSDKNVWSTFENHGILYSLLRETRKEAEEARDELLELLSEIHKKGWIKATTHGDTAVGDTLEHELGIERNCSKSPDYKGIELKASRVTKNGKAKAKTRITLFTRVPDEGLTYRQIIETYGKVQTPKGKTEARLQLYETFRTSRSNAYDLRLRVDDEVERLEIVYEPEDKYVSSWLFKNLSDALNEKHKETFFVKAKSKKIGGQEYFLYETVVHTRNPNVSILASLFAVDAITVDLAGHITNGKYRDHGVLFKMDPDNLSLIFGEPEVINLV